MVVGESMKLKDARKNTLSMGNRMKRMATPGEESGVQSDCSLNPIAASLSDTLGWVVKIFCINLAR
jgi:hypothetical protein